ncbi:DUF1905 domain-containing protein [Demequina capsici]|uniref:DUF1905 domain-containing protein n=1 Tax=Demequina capsici TaxID=3075620 RepID=A0AA96J914_9MICO|nr:MULTISPECIES: DUF1905 domain-containing protein [unclassified Demequina]WNM25528.1 DUF1905 domain-containing protein [Demequina sp. OYTSA14]WNM28419.1 DUF1905 domain-containing protein [Demequina sp. PMTSA13]
MTQFHFDADLYLWESRRETWVFADLPHDVADVIEDAQTGPRRGFGAVRVEVTLGTTTWRTSIFPSKGRGTYILPVKRAVLDAEGVVPTARVALSLHTV